MIDKKENIKKEIMEILFIFLEAKNSFYYAQYIFNPETRKEKNYITSAVEFQFFSSVLWKYSVIELCKLFKKNEKRSIPKLVNKFRKSGEFRLSNITDDIIKDWDDKLLRLNDLIENIIKMRDSVFAHGDATYKNSLQYNVIMDDTEKLILLTKEFISDIYRFALNATVVHTGKFIKKEFNILKILADEENKRIKDIFDEAKRLTNH